MIESAAEVKLLTWRLTASKRGKRYLKTFPSQELLAHSHISTTADIYVHGRREPKAGKATELLASQFVPVFSEEPVVEEQELGSERVQ
jgi:hypothetical protein